MDTDEEIGLFSLSDIEEVQTPTIRTKGAPERKILPNRNRVKKSIDRNEETPKGNSNEAKAQKPSLRAKDSTINKEFRKQMRLKLFDEIESEKAEAKKKMGYMRGWTKEFLYTEPILLRNCGIIHRMGLVEDYLMATTNAAAYLSRRDQEEVEANLDKMFARIKGDMRASRKRKPDSSGGKPEPPSEKRQRL